MMVFQNIFQLKIPSVLPREIKHATSGSARQVLTPSVNKAHSVPQAITAFQVPSRDSLKISKEVIRILNAALSP